MRPVPWRLSAVLLLAVLFTAGARADTDLEYAIKANYLYKFLPFIQWPSGTFQTQDQPFYICIIGPDPFGSLLDDAVKDQQVDGHDLQVKRLRVAEPGTDCRVMYITSMAGRSAAQGLSAMRGSPVLTITSDGDNYAHGIINFVLRDNHVRFEIDGEEAAQNHLDISSKLLDLAVSVIPRKSP